jgi:hypothetical protein
MIKKSGVYWKYLQSKDGDTILINSSDFTKEEAEQLGGKFFGECLRASEAGRYVHQIAEIGSDSFYIIIDPFRAIHLPVLRGNRKGRTLDSSEIFGFRKALFD